MANLEEPQCPDCGGRGVVMVRPAGHGHSDDLGEYEPCPKCHEKGALAKMSPQLRNVLYDLIRKVPPLADHGDQQAMNEFIAEVMPSPEPAPEVK